MSDAAPSRHWHVTERRGRRRPFGRMRVTLRLGADASHAVFGVLTRRVSSLLLDGWHLDLDRTSDAFVLLLRGQERISLEVLECGDDACLSARRAHGSDRTLSRT